MQFVARSSARALQPSSQATSCRGPVCRPQRCQRARVATCRATAAPEEPQGSVKLVQEVQQGWSKFLQRYEHSMLSSGIGAAAVTTWCMAHGQDPGTAATITVVATITALVLNELLFSEDGNCN